MIEAIFDFLRFIGEERILISNKWRKEMNICEKMEKFILSKIKSNFDLFWFIEEKNS